MTSDPAYASVRPGDAIVDFVLATVLQHVLHNLLHGLGIRKAEQLSPFFGYPTFVTTRDVPNPQTEVRRVGREAHVRFAFPQRLLSPPAFRHARGKRHRSNGEHSRPGLQTKKRLVFRFPDKWPETMHCAPNRDR